MDHEKFNEKFNELSSKCKQFTLADMYTDEEIVEIINSTNLTFDDIKKGL